jgi:hypothetical protein
MGGQLALDTANMPPVPPEILQQQQYITQQTEARAAAEKAAAQARQEAVTKTIAAMKLEAETAGMSDRQATLYRLTVQGATDTQIAYADSLLRTAEAQKAAYEAGSFGQAMFEEQALARRGMGGVTPNENFLADVDFSSFNLSDSNAPNNLSATQTLMGGDDESFNRILATLGIPNEQEKQTAFDYLWGVKLEQSALMEEINAFDLENQQGYWEAVMAGDKLVADMKKQNMTDALNFLMVAGGKYKAIALVGLAITKGVAMAETFVSGQAAAAAALAPPPLGLGPVAGAGLAAAIEAQTYIRMGLIAATGLMQAVQMSSQSSGGSYNSGGGTYSQPTVTQPQGIGEGGGSVTIILNGAIGEKQWFEDNVPVILQDLAARNVNIGYQPRADN